jgi:hypothetical protein
MKKPTTTRSPRQYGLKRTPEVEERFLNGLRKGWSPAKAAAAVNVARDTVLDWRQNDPDFKARWDSAIEEGTDLLEDEARRRAAEGVERGIYHAGEKIDTELVYSDTLMTLMLKGRRPKVYNRATDITLSGTEDGAPIKTLVIKGGLPNSDPQEVKKDEE